MSTPSNRAHRVSSFPAYTKGPAEFYGRAVLATPARRRNIDDPRPALRTKNRCRAFPQFPVLPAQCKALEVTPPAPSTESMTQGPSLSEHPVVVAVLLAVFAPVGVTLLWASPRFSNQAKVAITAFTAFVMLLTAACVFVVASRVCH